jgi:hypothetical protein
VGHLKILKWIFKFGGNTHVTLNLMFQELQFYIDTLVQLFPFVHWFNACPSPLYFLKAFKHGDLTVISSKSSTQQGDALQGVLFTLTHFCPLCPIATTHLTCVFPSLTNGMHIASPASNVILVFLRLQKKFTPLKLLL